MKKIIVVGLGIIGGSLAASLTMAGYSVYGFDLNDKTVEYAKNKGYIIDQATDFSMFDTVFIAIPPKATCALLNNGFFKNGALVIDICGIKSQIEKAVYSKERNFRYLGWHPMAGKETSGISSAAATMFKNANLIMTVCNKTEKSALEEAHVLAEKMLFGNIIVCSAEEHDKKIALTSQLAHIVSNAYVKSLEVKGCEPFTGGSFQDMTRIAGVDEKIWTELYLCNRENVLHELTLMIEHFKEYQQAIMENDAESLNKCLKEGRLIRETIKRKK